MTENLSFELKTGEYKFFWDRTEVARTNRKRYWADERDRKEKAQAEIQSSRDWADISSKMSYSMTYWEVTATVLGLTLGDKKLLATVPLAQRLGLFFDGIEKIETFRADQLEQYERDIQKADNYIEQRSEELLNPTRVNRFGPASY